MVIVHRNVQYYEYTCYTHPILFISYPNPENILLSPHLPDLCEGEECKVAK